MSNEEMAYMKQLLKRIEDNGNDGADIYDYTEFLQDMIKKYGENHVKLIEQIVTSESSRR